MARQKQPNPTASQREDLELVGGVLDELAAHLRVVANRREELSEGSFDPDLAATAAAIGKVLIAGAAERRNQRKSARVITREEAIAWLGALDRPERLQLVDEVLAIDDPDRKLL